MKNIFYLACPALGTDRIASMYNTINQWISSEALSELVNCFNDKIPNKLSITEKSSWLLDFSDRWDFRKLQQQAMAKDINEGARWLVDSSSLSDVQILEVEKAKKCLGLIGVERPTQKHYDYILVLGGAKLSCLLRPRLAADVLSEIKIHPRIVAMLAAFRPVAESEKIVTNSYAPHAKTEFDLINAGAEASFPILKEYSEDKFVDDEHPNKSWIIRRYAAHDDAPHIISLAAPSSEPNKRRANSADTYEFFFSKFSVPEGASLLLITSQIYVPYQQMEAIRTVAIPHNVSIETVGFPSDWGGSAQGMNEPTNYLQEIRSTIQSINRFISAYPLD